MTQNPTKEDNLKSYFSIRIDKLHDLEKRADSALFEFENELGILNRLADFYPELLDDAAKRTLEYINEREDITNHIETFCLEGKKTPFFTEKTLYDLIGKGDARHVLSLVRELVKKARA